MSGTLAGDSTMGEAQTWPGRQNVSGKFGEGEGRERGEEKEEREREEGLPLGGGDGRSLSLKESLYLHTDCIVT